jgi:tetratricopeptide (TPR) repeat protein
MEIAMSRISWAVGAGAAIALSLAAGAAQSAVTVIGGGLAEECAKAALAGRADDNTKATCSLALETELLNARDRSATYVNRGVIVMRQGDFALAQRDFDLAVKIKPSLGEAWVNRGAAQIGQKRYADSLPDINKGLELGVDEPHKAYFNRALAYEGLENAKAAYLDYQQALMLQPDWDAPKRELARFTVTRR